MCACTCACVVTQAEADSIDALENYRGKCEPTFLFYGVSVTARAHDSASSVCIGLSGTGTIKCFLSIDDEISTLCLLFFMLLFLLATGSQTVGSWLQNILIHFISLEIKDVNVFA